MVRHPPVSLFFFFNDTATTEIYTLSLHDALPIYRAGFPHRSATPTFAGESPAGRQSQRDHERTTRRNLCPGRAGRERSEEHTSELQSQSNLVCRLLLEKKKHRLPTGMLYHPPLYT